MLGPLVNAVVIAAGSLLGCFLVRGIPARFEETLKKAIGLATMYIGIRGALENKRALLLIMSLVLGALAGELIDIDAWMNRAGRWAERKLAALTRSGESSGGGNFAKAFASASILFCSGSMAIVGSIQSGLTGNHQIMYAKSVLDGSMSIVFGASLGIGTAFSAIPIIVYEGGIALLSTAFRDILSPEMITEMSAVGNLLVAAIGFNFLFAGSEDEGREIRVANLIPAVFIPCVFMAIEALFVKG